MSEHLSILEKQFGKKILSTKTFRGESTATVSLDTLHDVILFCKHDLGLIFLLDICSVDHEDQDPRFEVVYELATLDDSEHLRIKSPVSEDEEVPSVTDIWKTANWHEREVWDMMGIRFVDHPNLKRITHIIHCEKSFHLQVSQQRCQMLPSLAWLQWKGGRS